MTCRLGLSWQLVRYVLIAAIRDRMIWGILAISILGVMLSIFSGSAAAIEQDQFVITYMAGGLRILTLVGLSLFVVFYIRRSYDARDVEFLLTRPLSRAQFVISHSFAFSLLAFTAGLFLTALLGAISVRYGFESGFFLWAFGVAFEFILVVNVAFFFSMVLGSPVTAGLGTLGFYVLARMMGQLLAVAGSSVPLSHGEAFNGLAVVMQAISVVIPRFDLMTQTSWLIYGVGDGAVQDWLFIVLQTFVFLALVVTATVVDLRRRQF